MTVIYLESTLRILTNAEAGELIKLGEVKTIDEINYLKIVITD